MKGKDELEGTGTRSNFTPWLRDFEHQGENCLGVVATPPLGELGLRTRHLTLLRIHDKKRKFPLVSPD